jgi:hypothetical protein
MVAVAHDVEKVGQDASARPSDVVDTQDLATVTSVGEPAVDEPGVAALAGDVAPWGAPEPAPAAAPGGAPPPKPARVRYPHGTRRPAVGLAGLVLLTLVSAFFALVSAEPFWLANGRGTEGTVTVTSCRSSGIDERCVGRFAAGAFTVDAVRLSGVPEASRREGATFGARMLDAGSRWAYAGSTSGLRLRWQLGAGLVLLCGVLIGLVTGVGRLRDAGRRGRLLLWLISVAGPLLLYAGALGATLI